MLTEIRFEPPGDHPNGYLRGLLGIMPALAVTGVLKFTSSKRTTLRAVKLLFLGTAHSALAATPGGVPAAAESLTLISIAHPPIEAVQVEAGDNEVPFEIPLVAEAAVLRSLPGSVGLEFTEARGTNAAKGDAVAVVYELRAQIETQGGLFAAAKRLACEDEVDVPRYNVPLLMRSETADTTVFISGVNKDLDYRCTVSRGVFSLGQNVQFTLHHLRALNPSTVVKSVVARIRQDTIIKAKGQAKIVSHILATGVGKIGKDPNTKKGTAPTWSGECVAVIQESHKKTSARNAIDAVSGCTVSNMFAIKHFVELIVSLKDGRELCLDKPVEFEAVDRETREWLLQHMSKLPIEDPVDDVLEE
ncbi:hypothetical protein HDU83_000842 [Entophlyctis luteolus]|nr:hypothetical protein HDU83_000842 [Entophlyctis luteolus]KAJ3389081.1 hypothetical protein HDU84_009176 [Entophlyctis sp. JEL0112]